MKKISNLLILAVLAIGMGLTSCEGALDDILGEWSRPTPGNVTPGKVTAVTITTAPTATADSILVGSTTALVTAGVADGGTVMYKVTTDNTQPTSTDGFSAEKYRLTIGSEYKIDKKNRLELYYRFQRDMDDDLNSNILGVGYSLKF